MNLETRLVLALVVGVAAVVAVFAAVTIAGSIGNSAATLFTVPA